MTRRTDLAARDKQPLGERLARAALALHYNDSALHTLPVLQSCKIEGTRLVIAFDPVRLGSDALAVSSFNTSRVGSSAMEIQVGGAGSNWTFVNSLDSVNGTAVAIALPAGVAPSSLSGVRYAWGDNPCCHSLEPEFSAGEVFCPPMGCPLLTKGSQEPAVPFQARVVGGKCECDLPQVCS